MKTDFVVYRKISARIALLGLTQRDVAEMMGLSYGTLHNKLCKLTPFTLDEAIQLKQLLGISGSLEDAFERYDKKAGGEQL